MRNAFLISILILLNGCAYIVRPIVYNTIKKEPVPDYFYIHKGAKSGDMARYVGDHEHMKNNIHVSRIEGFENGIYEVVLAPEKRDVIDFEKHLFVRPDGHVEKAYVKIGNKKTPLKVESASPEGYFRSKKIEKPAIPQALDLNGQKYLIEQILTYEIFYDSLSLTGGSHRADISVVHLIDHSIPFGVVKTLMIMDNRVNPGAERFLDIVLKASDLDVFSAGNILSDLLNLTKEDRKKWRLVFTYIPPSKD